MTAEDKADPMNMTNMNVYSYLEHITPVFKKEFLKSMEDGNPNTKKKDMWAACMKRSKELMAGMEQGHISQEEYIEMLKKQSDKDV